MPSNLHGKAEWSTCSSASSAAATRLRSPTRGAAFLTNFSPGFLNDSFVPTTRAWGRMGQAGQVWVLPLRVPLPSCTAAGSLSNTLDPRAAPSAFAYPLVSKCKHSPASTARNRLKEESLRGDVVLYFSEEAGRALEDIGFSLSSVGF